MVTEKRLIDANKLWVAFDEGGLFDDGNPRHIAQEMVEKQPAVDAVEVVRCKDCRWRTERGLCYMIAGCGEGVGTGDDFFCQYGRKERQ